MAEDLGSVVGAVNFDAVSSGFATLGTILYWTLFIAVICGAAYFIWYWLSFKNTLVVRDVVNGRKLVRKYRWKEFKDKNKNIWMISPFKQLKKALPPDESIDITPKGKKWVEAWRGEDTETFIYAKDDFQYNKYKEGHPEFQPLTTQERELLVNEIMKSHEYKKKTTTEMILQIAMYMAPVILIAVIAITIGDVTEALVEYSKPLTSTLNNVANSFEEAAKTLAGVQEVGSNTVIAEAPN